MLVAEKVSLLLVISLTVKEVVLEDQASYIKGRNITTIIRFIDDAIGYLRVNNATGVIFALITLRHLIP